MKKMIVSLAVCTIFIAIICGISNRIVAETLNNSSADSVEYKSGIKPGDLVPLPIKTVSVSSFLVDNTGFDYSAPNRINARNGKNNPCWCEGKADSGIGRCG
jgi:hypothetical protein